MQDALTQYVIWFLLGILIIATTFYVFGAELPTYLGLGLTGLYLYAVSDNPLLKFTGGWMGRICIILFTISLIYYLGTKSFFPENPFQFRFLGIGLDFVNQQIEAIGGLVLSLFR